MYLKQIAEKYAQYNNLTLNIDVQMNVEIPGANTEVAGEPGFVALVDFKNFMIYEIGSFNKRFTAVGIITFYLRHIKYLQNDTIQHIQGDWKVGNLYPQEWQWLCNWGNSGWSVYSKLRTDGTIITTRFKNPNLQPVQEAPKDIILARVKKLPDYPSLTKNNM